jgi:hypothetical protein
MLQARLEKLLTYLTDGSRYVMTERLSGEIQWITFRMRGHRD